VDLGAVFFLGNHGDGDESRDLETKSMMLRAAKQCAVLHPCRYRITFAGVDALIAIAEGTDQSVLAASSTSLRESGAKVNSANPPNRAICDSRNSRPTPLDFKRDVFDRSNQLR
jgi:hypothetical protein